MPRNKIVNGVEVQLTPGEEKARDIEEAQAKLDDPDFTGNRTYLEGLVAMRQSQIDEIRAEFDNKN